MIDIHCHILPGIDDGSPDIRTSVEMARMAYADGIRHIVATPHFNANYRNTAASVARLVREVQAVLDQEGIEVKLHPGSEVRLENAGHVYSCAESEQFCYLGEGSRYILLEQSWTGFAPETMEIVDWFKRRGTNVVLPHPERHPFFRERPELIEELIEAGVWTQVSVDSLLGKNSPDAQAFGEWLIDRDWAHVLATDAHSLSRGPNLSAGFDIVSERVGAARAAEMHARAARIIGL